MTVGSASGTTAPEAARKGLDAARVPSASGPRAEHEALRRAYLDLLKLCLCDLVGATTGSVGRTADGAVASRELAGEQRRLRAAGMDWPLQGLTMIGLDRLDDLQRCVESVVSDHVDGDLIEAGTWRGGASILMRATLDSLGAQERSVCVADSFQGFPAGDGEPWGAIEYLAVALEEVRANFARLGLEHAVEFVPGYFSETLPGLSDRRWSLVRLDADTYDATLSSLRWLYPGLSIGGYLIIDDYGALGECRAAVDEFRVQCGIEEPIEQVDWTCVRWRRAHELPFRAFAAAAAIDRGTRRPGAEHGATAAQGRVPTLTELELSGELEATRRALAAARDELARLRRSPSVVARERLRRLLGRRAAR